MINKDKYIPGIQYAEKKEEKQTLFKSPVLTPITLVSKFPKMDADFYVEPEVGEGWANYVEAKRFIQEKYKEI